MNQRSLNYRLAVINRHCDGTVPCGCAACGAACPACKECVGYGLSGVGPKIFTSSIAKIPRVVYYSCPGVSLDDCGVEVCRSAQRGLWRSHRYTDLWGFAWCCTPRGAADVCVVAIDRAGRNLSTFRSCR